MQENKQNIVIFGSCVTAPIYKILHTSTEFNKKYDIKLLKHCFECTKADTPAIIDAVKNCDILITQPIGGQNYIKLGLDTNTLKTFLSNNAKTILIPTPYFTGYNPEQFYLRNAADEHVGNCIGLTHPYHNKLILFGYINNLTPQETLKFLNSDDNMKNIQKNVKENITELTRREQCTDFKISDFIEKHYLHHRLFWTENHPTNYLLEFMAKEILKLLDIKGDVTCEEDFLSNIQTPILNSIKKELKLKFKDNNIIKLEDIENYYKYYNNNKDLVKINKDIAIEFCKGIIINKQEKKYDLLRFIPIWRKKKQQTKKLSVITICYNIKETIARTCESIVNQTWQDFEWIVVDGGSTDGTLDILNKYKDRINVLISESDTGVYNAMNKGIKVSIGEYITFMNGGDCYYDNNVLEKIFKDKKYNSDILYGWQYFKKEKKFRKFVDKIDLQYLAKYSLGHQATFYKKYCFKKFGFYNEKFKITADQEINIRFCKNKCKFEYLNYPISWFACDGISSNPKSKELFIRDWNMIYKKYYKPKEVLKYGREYCKTYFVDNSIFKRIFSSKISQNKKNKKWYFLGLPVFRIKQKNENEKKYYICAIPILKIKEKY